jgi:hypothetical protein
VVLGPRGLFQNALNFDPKEAIRLKKGRDGNRKRK